MMITDEQLLRIQGYLMSEGITDVSLQEDLTDHFSCMIEGLMKEGKNSFEEAFETARLRIAPDGAREIQKDTHYLLNIKNRIMIRKLVYLTAFLGVLTMVSAGALRIPGFLDAHTTRLLIFAGLMLTVTGVLPYVFYRLYERSVKQVREA